MPKTMMRFCLYVDPGMDADDCWLWTGGTADGYGKFKLAGGHVGAHRWAYEHLGCNPPPGKLLVCHSCDNPLCVNPSHLFLGTVADNNRDKLEKRRHSHGSRPRNSKLTDAMVATYKERRRLGWSRTSAARDMPVSQSVLYRIDKGLKWRHVS
jgi:hypothetical protein